MDDDVAISRELLSRVDAVCTRVAHHPYEPLRDDMRDELIEVAHACRALGMPRETPDPPRVTFTDVHFDNPASMPTTP